MKNIMSYFIKFKECQKGITSIEYGLIALVIAVFVVAVLYGERVFLTALQTKLQLLTSTIVTALLTK